MMPIPRRDEAVRWYDSFDELTMWNLVLQGPAQLRAGTLLDSLGRTEALLRYRKAARLLAEGTGPYAGLAREARRASIISAAERSPP